LVIITASCQKLKNPFLDRPDYQPNRAPKRPNATVNKFRFLRANRGDLADAAGPRGTEGVRI
ncbi:MAG: hypothetical protein ABSH35_22000, partial [Isosphaeraceae bacterium]